MKLNDIYRDVTSRLNQLGVRDYQLTYNDVVSAINDSISQQRVRLINEGVYQDFLVTENLFVTIEDFSYPFLSKFKLKNDVLTDLPIHKTAIVGSAQIAEKELLNKPQTFSKGEVVRKGMFVYTAIEDIQDINTYNLTFEISDVVTYRHNNGLKYNKGDIILDVVNEEFFHVDEDFKSNNSTVPQLTKLYWKKIYNADKPAYFYEFKNLNEFKTVSLYNEDVYIFGILKDTIYVSPKVNRFTVSYIPKWKYVEDPDTILELPDFMIMNVKNQAVEILGAKLGMNLIDRRVSERTPENE